MGYQQVEFSANPYLSWSPAEAKQVRSLLDGLNLTCRSTHNEIVSFSGDGLSKAIELNRIIGSTTLVAVRGPAGSKEAGGPSLDDWKSFNDQLSQAVDRVRAAEMTIGFHNHGIEFQPVEGVFPADLVAANRAIQSFHVNIGLALQGGGDPAAFIKKCPGRVQTILAQDYMGQANWKQIFAAAEGVGGLDFYLIQRADGLGLVDRDQSDALENVRLDLEYFRKLYGAA